MEQPRRTRRPRRRGRSMDEGDEREVTIRNSELDGVVRSPDLSQADRIAIECSLGLEVSNRELDGAERGGRIDGQSALTVSPRRTTPGCSTWPHTPIGNGSPPSAGR